MTLAGPVAEFEYLGGLELMDMARSRFVDLDTARRLIVQFRLYGPDNDVDSALRAALFEVRVQLRPHEARNARLAERLIERDGRLSARSVRTLLK